MIFGVPNVEASALVGSLLLLPDCGDGDSDEKQQDAPVASTDGNSLCGSHEECAGDGGYVALEVVEVGVHTDLHCKNASDAGVAEP